MKLETDLTRIQRLAEERARVNWAFRSFLKASDLPAARIDRVVRKAFRSAAAQIDCTRCANCCKVVGPVLGPADVERLAAAQGFLLGKEVPKETGSSERQGSGPTRPLRKDPPAEAVALGNGVGQTGSVPSASLRRGAAGRGPEKGRVLRDETSRTGLCRGSPAT